MKNMKTIFRLLIALLIFSSCSNTDNNNNDTASSLIGTWIGVSSTLNGKSAGIPDNSILKFTADNRAEFIYEKFGNNGEDISDFGDWSKNDNILTIKWDDSDPGLEIYVLTILELNDTTLKWSTDIYGIANNQQVFEGTLTETFVKQESVEVSQINPSDIIGEWEYYSQEYKNYGNFSEFPYLVTGCGSERYYKYNSDGTNDRYDFESVSSTSNDNIQQNGFIIREYTCIGDLILRGTRNFQIDGNVITWTNSDQTVSRGIIETLNKEKLVILWNDNLSEFSNWKNRDTFKRK